MEVIETSLKPLSICRPRNLVVSTSSIDLSSYPAFRLKQMLLVQNFIKFITMYFNQCRKITKKNHFYNRVEVKRETIITYIELFLNVCFSF
jgi:hypothetical protein